MCPMHKSEFEVVPYESKYANQTVEMWRNSKEQALGQKEVHSFDNHVYFLNHILPEKYQIEIVLHGGQVVGIIAFNKNEISQLYVHIGYQRKGIGHILLDRAKKQSSGRLTLYTFEINRKAQRFYEKHGFKVIAKGHENEENLPDLLYEWTKED